MFTLIVDLSVIFCNLGFWNKSNVALRQDQQLQVHNHVSPAEFVLYARVGHRYSFIR